MKIQIVTEPERRRWVLRPISEALAKELPGATVGERADPDADVNFFINYVLYRSVPTYTMALFTHREREGRWMGVFDSVALKVDWCFAMCKITASLLPLEKTTILPMYPVDRAYYKTLVIGVVGRGYATGRKRMHWVEDLQAIEGVEIKRPKKIPAKDMPAFYDSIDYLVVLSDNEGGPLPVVEAMARGKPVIAPNVGFCWEYPVLRYETKEELLAIVRRLVIPRDGWEQSAQMVLEVFQDWRGEGRCNGEVVDCSGICRCGIMGRADCPYTEWPA